MDNFKPKKIKLSRKESVKQDPLTHTQSQMSSTFQDGFGHRDKKSSNNLMILARKSSADLG
jgi:hypothetical protein